MKRKTPFTFGVLNIPPQRSADYLKTLAEWRDLDLARPLPLTELASLVAAICNQNAPAILKILGDAVWNTEVPYFGLSHHGHWQPFMMLNHFPSGVRSDEIPPPERSKLHYEAVGMAPKEAVYLLQRRGRKIPAELQELLGEPERPVEQTQEEKDAALLAAYRGLGGQIVGDEFRGKRGALSALEKKDGRKRQTLQPMLLRAAARETSAAPFAQMSRQLKKG